jgi:hypothetical protein
MGFIPASSLWVSPHSCILTGALIWANLIQQDHRVFVEMYAVDTAEALLTTLQAKIRDSAGCPCGNLISSEIPYPPMRVWRVISLASSEDFAEPCKVIISPAVSFDGNILWAALVDGAALTSHSGIFCAFAFLIENVAVMLWVTAYGAMNSAIGDRCPERRCSQAAARRITFWY